MLSHVKQWQQVLKDNGYDILVDGVFGAKSLDASLQAIGQPTTGDKPIDSTIPDLQDGYITTNFKRSEFERRAVVPVALLENLKVICDILEEVRLVVNNGDPKGNKKIEITSGYRTQAQNDALYNQTNKRSMHVLAGAASTLR